jgi:hypothetical protein
MAGFATAVRQGLTLNVRQRTRVDFQSVEISAESPLLETGTSSIGQVVQNKSILELPLNGRIHRRPALYRAQSEARGRISSRRRCCSEETLVPLCALWNTRLSLA